MKSFGALTSFFATLSLNNSSSNKTLGGILINDNHRYLIQKYFDNERSFTMTTVGPQTLTLTTSTLATGSISATLTAAWTYISCQQLVVFSDGEQRTVFFTQGSTNIYWQSATNAVQTSASISAVGVQSYRLPANISKLKTSTITIGQLVYTAYPVNSVQEWAKLNALPYTAAYPAYFFVFNDELQFWPIPSSTGNIITLYAQINVADMTYQDYSTGTINTASVGSNIITGTSTTWNSVGNYPLNTDLTFANLFIQIAPPGGDGLYYQIQSFQSDTSLTLIKPLVNAPNTSGASYTIGQYPLLQGDFHDIPVYWALKVYHSSISKDTDKASLYDGIMANKLTLMEAYLSTKQVSVDLGTTPIPRNPNLYPYATSNTV